MSSPAQGAPDIDGALAPHAVSHPRACDVIRQVGANRLLRDAVAYLLQSEPEYVPTVAPFLDVLEAVYRRRNRPFAKALEALDEYTQLYMRHQVSFLATGAYSNSRFEDVYASVYDNEALMSDTYLPGLYLTQLFWPIHYRILEIYRREVLAPLAQRPQALLEVGVGHGATLLSAMRARPGSRATALDVSRHSLGFVRELLDAEGVAEPACAFVQADVTRSAVAGVAADVGTMGELLEHVEEPARALRHMHQMLKPGARAFLTTVIDSNAVDHIHQFKSQDEIDALIRGEGFTIEQSALIRPADLRLDGQRGSDPTLYYYAVARSA